MLVQYTAEKGLKLYGDEAFCSAAIPVQSARNLLINGDLRYGTYGWLGGSGTTLSIVAGKLNALDVSGPPEPLLYQVIDTDIGSVYLFVFKVEQTLASLRLKIQESDALGAVLENTLLVSGHGTNLFEFTATSTKTYIELGIAVAAGVVSFTVSSMRLTKAASQGAPYANLVLNPNFTIDTANWVSLNGAVLTLETQKLRVTNGTAAASSALAVMNVISGDFYKLQFSYRTAYQDGYISVGRIGSLPTDYGLTYSLTADIDSHLIFRPDVTGQITVGLSTTPGGVGNISMWDSITLSKCNDTIVNGKFFSALFGWVTTQWLHIASTNYTYVTGNMGAQIYQDQLASHVIGQHYTYTITLVVPGDSLIVKLRNLTLSTDALELVYTSSGTYAFSFVAEDTDIRLIFESGTAVETLQVSEVRGGLSEVDVTGTGAAGIVEGRPLIAGSVSNTETPQLVLIYEPLLTTPAVFNEQNFAVPITEVQKVGVGDFTVTGWIDYAETSRTGIVTLYYMGGGTLTGLTAPSVLLSLTSVESKLKFDIIDGVGGVESVTTFGSAAGSPIFFEAIREAGEIFIRLGSKISSAKVASTFSLDLAPGFNFVGKAPGNVADTLNGLLFGRYGGISLCRFIPSAVSSSRSVLVFNSEKQLFNPNNIFSQAGQPVILVVEEPTVINSEGELVGSTFIPDLGDRQETIVQRYEEVLSAASKALTPYEVIAFKHFLESTVRGGEFLYDPYAIDIQNLIEPYQVFLRQKSVNPVRQGSLEEFIYSWSMRVKGVAQ